MVVGVLGIAVVDEEIDTRGVGYTFEHDQYNRPEVDAFTHRWDDEEDGPSEQHIDDQRGLGKAVEKEDLEEDAGERQEPDDAKCCPSGHEVMVFDDAHADRSVARSNEHIDRTMVEDAECPFVAGIGFAPMVDT